jgi:hypothetical protein
MARAHATTDHQVIRRWIEAHGGHPSVVRATEGRRQGSAGLLRVDFDEPEESLEAIGWDDFFDTFDSNDLAFLYQDEEQSRFHKFVKRDSVDTESTSTSSGSKASSGSKKGGGAARQASPAEQNEAEEIDEEELDEEEEEEEEDEDEDEDER